MPQPSAVTEIVLTAQESRLAQAVRSFQFDASLAPYNLSALQQWRSLSGHITKVLIEKVAPLNKGNLSVTTEADPFLKGPKTAAEERLAAQLQAKAGFGSQKAQSAAKSRPESSGVHVPPQAHVGSGERQPAATSGTESAASDHAGRGGTAGQPTDSSAPNGRDRHAPEEIGSAAAHDQQPPGKQAPKGVGRCFYIAVPTRATVSECNDEFACLNVNFQSRQ